MRAVGRGPGGRTTTCRPRPGAGVPSCTTRRRAPDAAPAPTCVRRRRSRWTRKSLLEGFSATPTPGVISWSGRYYAGQCTFCGRCVEFCPTRAIVFEPWAPPVTRDASSHRVTHPVPCQPCSRCGRPVTPLPEATLVRLYEGAHRAEALRHDPSMGRHGPSEHAEPLPDGVKAEQRLCEKCRGRLSADRLRKVLSGEAGEDMA